jgi:adenine-specific DNA-methyltransferase
LYNYLSQYIDKENKEGKNIINRPSQGDFGGRYKVGYNLVIRKKRKNCLAKIVTKEFSFCLVPKNLYILDSIAFMVGDDLNYLLGVLNSKIIDFYVKSYIHLYGDTGFLLSNQYVERIPIPAITSANKGIVDKIVDLVDRIIQLKNQDINNDISNLEREINELVYKLYDLTQDEIKIIEESK